MIRLAVFRSKTPEPRWPHLFFSIGGEKGEFITLSHDSLLENAVQLIVDTCIFYEANCDNCELKEFCSCNKPIEYSKENN